MLILAAGPTANLVFAAALIAATEAITGLTTHCRSPTP
jgi:hypothetical protein